MNAGPRIGKGVKRAPTGNPALSRATILAAALRIVDDAGLDALTMRALATDLGVYPNALYWHIRSRSQLIGDVSTLILEEVVLPDEDDDWGRWLTDVAQQWRRAMHRHPNLAVVAGTQLVTTIGAMPFVERVLRVLQAAGFQGRALVFAYNTFVGFVTGWLTLELSTERPDSEDSWKAAFADQLAALDADTFPTLTEVMPLMRGNAFLTRWSSGRTHPLEESFDAALVALVDGLHAQLEQGRQERSRPPRRPRPRPPTAR